MITHHVSEVVESNITLLDLFREGASEVSFEIREHDARSKLGLFFTANEVSTCTSSSSQESRKNLLLSEERKKNTVNDSIIIIKKKQLVVIKLLESKQD